MAPDPQAPRPARALAGAAARRPAKPARGSSVPGDQSRRASRAWRRGRRAPRRVGVARHQRVLARSDCTIARCTPMPRPWISRTSVKPRAWAAFRYSSTTEGMSRGAKACRSRASSIGMRTGSSSVRSDPGPGRQVLGPVLETQEILPRELALSERGGALEERHVDHRARSRRARSRPPSAVTICRTNGIGMRPRRCRTSSVQRRRVPGRTGPSVTVASSGSCSHVSGTSCCRRSDT